MDRYWCRLLAIVHHCFFTHFASNSFLLQIVASFPSSPPTLSTSSKGSSKLLLPSPVHLQLLPPSKALPRCSSMNISIDPSQFLIKIWNATVGQLKHLRSPEPRIEEMKDARERLEAKADDIIYSINLAQREGKIPTRQVQLWLRDVNELKGKATAIEQYFQSRRCLGAWSWNCFSVNRRVAKRMDDIHELMAQSFATKFAMKPPPLAVVQIPISNSTFGMEAYTREILGYIDHTEVIGIYGMAGVGKTTLLKNINNHIYVTVFDYVIFAVASKECTMERLQMDIAKRLKLDLTEEHSESERGGKLFNFLMNKKCLLLLDDLWATLDLTKLGMAQATPEQGYRNRKVVVFTTRNEQVCGIMHAGSKMEIKCLEQEQARDLFRMHAGEAAIGRDPGIDRIAPLIAQQCAGLPLALVTVGKAMSKKKTWDEWDAALTLMKDSEMLKVMDAMEADPMFSAFKLSYESLEDEDMRDRLLSCSLWPEHHSINKEELIDCWMGLGLIDEDGTIHKTYSRGYSHIETLKSACLLEPSDEEEGKVKMHDVIRNMALWQASDCGKKKFEWIVRSGIVANQALVEESWYEAKRVSLMHNKLECLPKQLFNCSELSVLIVQHNYKLKAIPGTLIQAMRALTYLDLQFTQISEIPKVIGVLSELQHLNLSWTPVKELPAELGLLRKLKYLLLRSTSDLITVAKGSISKLSLLRLLDLRGSKFVHYSDELEGLTGCLKYISIDIRTKADLQRLSKLPHVITWRLCVNKLEDSKNLYQLLDDIARSHNIRQNVEQLQIVDVRMDELLISEGNKEFQCLKYLDLCNLHLLSYIRWRAVQPGIFFPKLREICIYECDSLRNVNWTMQLPSLSVLCISCCSGMEELLSDEGTSDSPSFGLRSITLHHMDNLRRISPRPLRFPYLEEMEVLICPNFTKLPFDNRISMNSRLKTIRCEQTWWDNLDWEERSIKDALSPLVTQYFVPRMPRRLFC